MTEFIHHSDTCNSFQFLPKNSNIGIPVGIQSNGHDLPSISNVMDRSKKVNRSEWCRSKPLRTIYFFTNYHTSSNVAAYSTIGKAFGAANAILLTSRTLETHYQLSASI